MTPKIGAIGEVLWDLLPSGPQMGGAPANFACHAQNLGADAELISRVGEDPLGRQILHRLASLHVSTVGVAIDPAKPTGTVGVQLGADGQPRFTIREDVAWDNLQVCPETMEITTGADAICFGTLCQRQEPSRSSIQQIVAAVRPEALRVFDINLRQHYYSAEVIQKSLQLANVLKLNDAELPVIAALLGLHGSIERQLEELSSRFDLRLVAYTRGAQGSLLFGSGKWSSHNGIQAQVRDTVGAGDSFTAALTLGLLANAPLEEINHRANEIAAFVCSQNGATPTLADHLRKSFLSSHSTD